MRVIQPILFSILFVISGYNYAQHNLPSYTEIPNSARSHPELGKLTHSAHQLNEVDYELVHLRTAHTRTFLNKNKTKTTVQSSQPLHHLDENGFWLSIDYTTGEEFQYVVFPVSKPLIRFDKTALTTELSNGSSTIQFGQGTRLVMKDQHNQTIKELTSANGAKQKIDRQSVSLADFFPSVNWSMSFFHGAVKSELIVTDKSLFPGELDKLMIEEVLQVPDGFQFGYERTENGFSNRLIVTDFQGVVRFAFEPPVLTDSRELEPKFQHLRQNFEATYEIEAIDHNRYLVRMIIPGNWLLSDERVFPVIIDPVVTVVNTDVVNSCFLPNYQQSNLSIAVPAGETILSADISYDFVATNGSNAWIADQLSYVTGPNGQSPILEGQGNFPGTFTYTLNNSPIANSVSTGQVNIEFYFSRNWGGSGCNSTFNFSNRREVTLTYGTIIYGDGPIYINEYSASNRSINDGFGRTEDWIELYNANPTDFFDLSGYYLSNSAANPTQWQVQNGIIPPNSRLLIICSKRDISSGMVQHTNFNLTQLRPDQVVLANPQGQIIESHEMFVTQTNHSYGRLTDGGNDWGVFNTPTPGQTNTGGFMGYTSKPTFDVEAGNYPSTQLVTISSSGSNEQIRYTTNGSTPTPSSNLYTGPITVASTTVLRARSFSSNPQILPGFIETNTYLINENHTLPIFSFAGDADILALFNGNNTLRPRGHFEYFERDGQFVDENFGDFDKHGNDSWNYAQRGVDFVSRDDHGYNRRLEHQFFATSDRTRFRRLMVKAAANDNYPHANGGAHIRDSYVQTLSQLAGLDLDERSSTNVILYLNGQYWGVYDVRERVDDNNFTDYYYNQDYIYRESDDYLQFLKTWGATQAHFGNQPAITAWSSLTQYVQNNNMGVQTNFDFVNSQLNIGSLIDYFVINSFVVSRDWLNYNTGWWRGTNPLGDAQKWRYILWDMEGSLGHYINFTGMPDVSATASPCQVENLNVGQGHTQTLRKLIQENPSVRQMYITRYADLLNTHLSCDRIVEVFDSMVAVIAPEMPRQISRWGGNLSTWQANVQNARNFLLTRCSHLMNTGLANCYNLTGPFATTFNVEPAGAGQIKMNSEWLPTYPFAAQVFGNIETLLQSESFPGYTFSHWVVDGAVINPDPTSPSINIELSQATNVTAHFNEIPTGSGDLIYYWHFNNLNTPNDVTQIPADYQLIQEAAPLMTYTGTGPRDIDANNNGSVLNLHQDEEAGRCARVRNPSDNRALVFDLPTTGYENIYFDYAVERTNQGQLNNLVSYSIDGSNFITAGLSESQFSISTEFGIISLDFTGISQVNNNPNFKVRISFEGNTTASNGNNRFDNITLKGTPMVDLSLNESSIQTEIQVFPNPFTDAVTIRSSSVITKIDVYDLMGKRYLSNAVADNKQTQLNLGELAKGVYMIQVSTQHGEYKVRLVKQ